MQGYLFVLQERVCEMLSKILANLEMVRTVNNMLLLVHRAV